MDSVVRSAFRTLLFAFISVTACAGEDKANEALSLCRALQYPQQFMLERQEYMQHAEQDGLEREQVLRIGQRIFYADYESELCSFIGDLLTKDELLTINTFLATSAGRREYAEMRAMYRQVKAGTMEVKDVNARSERFFKSLSPDDKKTMVDFYQTSAGKKYRHALGAISEKSAAIFSRMLEAAIHQVFPPPPPKADATPATPPEKAKPTG